MTPARIRELAQLLPQKCRTEGYPEITTHSLINEAADSLRAFADLLEQPPEAGGLLPDESIVWHCPCGFVNLERNDPVCCGCEKKRPHPAPPRGGELFCTECGSPFANSHYTDCKVATGMKASVEPVKDLGEGPFAKQQFVPSTEPVTQQEIISAVHWWASEIVRVTEVWPAETKDGSKS